MTGRRRTVLFHRYDQLWGLDDRQGRRSYYEPLTIGNLPIWIIGRGKHWLIKTVRVWRYRWAMRRGEPTRCGRRDDMIYAASALSGQPQPPTGSPEAGPDRWMRLEALRTCSYCGGVHPDDALRSITSGVGELSSTNKNYKVYVKVERQDYKAYRQHFTDVQWLGLWRAAKEKNAIDRWRDWTPEHLHP